MSNWYKQLEDDLKWREEELDLLKNQVRVSKDATKQALLRSLLGLLYAHYEGFCKFAWDLYLKELRNAQIKRKDCRDELAIFSLQDKFKQLKKDLSSKNLWKFGKTEFQIILEEMLEFPEIKINKNLHPNVFQETSNQIGLNCQLVEQYQIEIKTLVARRNEIAHGKPNIIRNLDDYKKYENAVVEVMHELAVLIIDCLDKKLYLKNL